MLLDGTTGQVMERYHYTAFGEEKVFDGNGKAVIQSIVGNPWRFSSKRVDDETGFVYFGRRYYDPSTSRWVTPDPLGFDAGPNLYAYVMNSPLTHIDLYGLFGTASNGAGCRPGFFQNAYSFTRTAMMNTMRFTGGILDFCGELLPIPPIKDAFCWSGKTMMGKSNEYVASWNEKHSCNRTFGVKSENPDNNISVGYCSRNKNKHLKIICNTMNK